MRVRGQARSRRLRGAREHPGAELPGGKVHVTYDAHGNVLQRTDTYVMVSYAYDGLDRVVSASASNSVDGSSVAYAFGYDTQGGEWLVESPGWLAYGYDGNGNRTSETVEGAAATFNIIDHDLLAPKRVPYLNSTIARNAFVHDYQANLSGPL